MADNPVEEPAPLTTHDAADAIEGLLDLPETTGNPDASPDQDNLDENPEPEANDEADPETEDAKPEEDETQEDPDLVEWKDENGQAYRIPRALHEGQMRLQDYRKKTEELARSRETFQSESTRVAEAIKARADRLDGLIESLEGQAGEQRADLDRILQEDGPEAYIIADRKAQATREALEAAKAERAREAQETEATRKAEFEQFVMREHEKIAEDWPEFRDPANRTTVTNELYSYLESLGFPREQAMQVIDHRQVKLIRKAMAYDKAEAARQGVKKVIEGKPKMLKPGQAPTTDRQAEAAKRKIGSLRRTGSRDDAAAIFETIL